MKTFLLAIGLLFLVGCECSDGKTKNTYKYKEGDVVYLKPDSLKVTIIRRYQFDVNGYEVRFFERGGDDETTTVKEYEIFGKQF